MNEYLYVEAPNDLKHLDNVAWRETYENSIFLAGSITGSHDWQALVINRLLPVFNVFNPRRKSFNVNDPKDSEMQIDWEFLQLRYVKNIIFYFSFETLAPITLLEFGSALERGKLKHNLYVACHPDYKRKFDVEYQAAKFGVKVYDSLNSAIDQAIIEGNAAYKEGLVYKRKFEMKWKIAGKNPGNEWNS